MSTNAYKITDEQWDRIKNMLPEDHVEHLTGMSCMVHSGLVIPAHNGKNYLRATAKSTVHERFESRKDKGILEKIFTELIKDCDMQDLYLDSTSCKVRQHASGAKRVFLKLLSRLRK